MAKRLTNKQKTRTKAEQRAETLERMLDAAEYLFSKHGLNGVTLRDVALKVGVHTSLMHYYFVDKRRLFEAVFTRRAGTTSSRRLDALDHYERECGGAPTVEGALRAFLDTDLDLYINGGEGWRNFAAFAAQVSNSPEGAAMMDLHFNPVVLKLIGILKKALPGCSDADIFWGYDFVSGAFLHVLGRTGRIDHLSGGVCKSEDFAAVKDRLASFMAAGFTALCVSSGKAVKPRKSAAARKKHAR
ncbi:MAG: TetR/AcrR family transcriptional regulator [Pseudomonadota bacterium]|jgi:AcrR family transcriptional regulator|nr:TetR/AcrR family transcriptional regulator [Pseudomonadota bacterium]